jgi:hypothetical protein
MVSVDSNGPGLLDRPVGVHGGTLGIPVRLPHLAYSSELDLSCDLYLAEAQKIGEAAKTEADKVAASAQKLAADVKKDAAAAQKKAQTGSTKPAAKKCAIITNGAKSCWRSACVAD